MTYAPMRELLVRLRAEGLKTFIGSGGDIEFVRPWAKRIYGIAPEQVIASSSKTMREFRDGRPVLVRLPGPDFIHEQAGMSVGIHQRIGRRPLNAFGNSEGDLEMLGWAARVPGARLGVLVHRDGDEREFACDRKSHVGRLDRGLDQAGARGWTVVGIHRDWKTVFALPRRMPDEPRRPSSRRGCSPTSRPAPS
jgi:hypothetical protein